MAFPLDCFIGTFIGYFHVRQDRFFLKSVVAKRFYRYDVRQYAKLLDILYLPSEEMKKHIPALSI